VLHHLSTVDRRYAVISELLRITKPGGVVMIQAWALEQGSDSKRTFESQDTMVPWRLSKRFLSEAQQQQLLGKGEGKCEGAVDGEQQRVAEVTRGLASAAMTPPAPADTPTGAVTQEQASFPSPPPPAPARPSTDSGACKHVTEDSGELVFQRYCHVYKEGELEELCSSIPGCVVSESGWDKGNWFVQLRKVQEGRLEALPAGPESKIPVLAPRGHH
jgi:alkylated DNA repair protein alkB family protein 8